MTEQQALECAVAGKVAQITSESTFVGVDAVSIVELARDVAAAGDEFLAMCYCADEIAYCAGDLEKLASRFAIKEATLKVLGTGIRGIGMLDIVVVTAESGEPLLELSHDAQEVASRRGLSGFRCSATHETGYALAVVVATSHHDSGQERS